MNWYESLLDQGLLPDWLLRVGIRQLLGYRIASLDKGSVTANNDYKTSYVESLKRKDVIALHTKEANEQHYEIPTAFFQQCLGQRMKYSCCFYENGAKNLDEAEIHMLDLYFERAQIKDGMTCLDLGCGWGSVCLYLCEKFPNSQVYALSNSASQREYIESVAKAKKFKLQVFTGDINTFEFPKQVPKFDRIISIEMFEHMKNYECLFQKISNWLIPDTGRLFCHVFCHKSLPYDFKTDEGDHNWMARYFFTSGTMPSEDLFLWFQKDLLVLNRWTVDGKNYGQTSEDWLKKLDENKVKALAILLKAYKDDSALANVWFNRWRIFYLAVAELFNYSNGQEWMVVHYLFKKK